MFNCIFVDSIFISSFLAVIFICMTTALWGGLLLVSRQPLLSESLSHACYPGLLIGALISYWTSTQILPIIVCGCLAAILGFYSIEALRKTVRMHKDSALCFVLVAFFGIGVVVSTYVKSCSPVLFNRIHAYLYGQAATLGTREAWLAFYIFILSLLALWWWYRQILVMLFDKEYAMTCGLNTRLSEQIILIFISLVIVSGVRSIGIILLASMFVAPPLAARQFSDKLSYVLLLSCLFGGVSGALGSYVSVVLQCKTTIGGKASMITLPTGPLIVIIAGSFTILSLIFSFKTGWLFRFFRKKKFLFEKSQEDLLKTFWYLHEQGLEWVSDKDLVRSHRFQEYFGAKPYPYFKGYVLKKQHLLEEKNHLYRLTDKGLAEANQIIRTHRLWESFLVQRLDFKEEAVHLFAEEVEHVLTEEINQEISNILDNPSCDPHQQIIPKKPTQEKE